MSRNALKSTGHQQAILASLGLGGGDLRHVSRRISRPPREHQPTVAQTMGLLPKQPDKVNWVELEREAISKGHFDSSCPICLTRHGQKRRKSVVTSCGHVFHMSCLRATRINQASPKCPLCRSEYKSHVAVEGIRHARKTAATTVQAGIRGWLVRRKLARKYPAVFRIEARKLRLADFGRQINRDMSKLQKDSAELITQSDIALEKARQIFSQIKLDPAIIHDQYREARKRAQCESTECPVCLVPLGTKPISLLSCSHVLHDQCRSQLESFVDEIKCPMCRQNYTYITENRSA